MINELILFYWERRFEKNKLHFNNNTYTEFLFKIIFEIRNISRYNE